MIPDVKRNLEYFESMAILKEKYKNQIDVKIALEVEWYPHYIPLYKKYKEEGLVDYLIFGNHGYLNENQISRADELCFLNDGNYLDLYYECLKNAVESKLFKYICHPDCFLKGYRKWDEKAIELTYKIAKLLQDNNMYAELSAPGVRNKIKINYNGQDLPTYPFKEFYKILSTFDIKFVLGCDAHSPEQLDDYAVKYICDMAKELNLNV